MRWIIEVAGWWVILVVVWWASLNSFSYGEVGVAAGCAVPVALLAGWARRAVGGSWRPRMRWLAWSARVPVSAVVDTVRLLVRPRATGQLRTIGLGGDTDGAVAAAVVSATPGSVALAVSDAEMVLHVLPRKASAIERAVRS